MDAAVNCQNEREREREREREIKVFKNATSYKQFVVFQEGKKKNKDKKRSEKKI